MGANETLGLPRDKMKKVTVAFDIDGTLRCNCTPTCQDKNQRIVSLAHILSHFKNVQLHAWSGGGKDYAYQFVRHSGLEKLISEARCHSKLEDFRPDIAIDDIQDTALGKLNLIVKEK